MTDDNEDWDAIHAAMTADKGDDWKLCDTLEDAAQIGDASGWLSVGAKWREAMHDRDGLHAERDMWREEALKQMRANAHVAYDRYDAQRGENELPMDRSALDRCFANLRWWLTKPPGAH